ncbi:MAG TPA: pilus assembly protein N-terminal domain-containing protein [Microvirga sp.]|nr:pilus assembly protein N-terminal domain-containing protein [Microvirga sp.]
MRRRPGFLVRSALVAVPLLLLSGGVAAQDVQLMPGTLTILKPARAVKTIAIGKPDVADATVENARTIIVTGKSIGSTSMVLLDEAGSEISHISVRVGGPQFRVRILEGGANAREYLCEPTCSPVDRDNAAARPAVVITPALPENGSGAAAARATAPAEAGNPR